MQILKLTKQVMLCFLPQSVLLITALDEIIHCVLVLKTDQKPLKIMILCLSINFH